METLNKNTPYVINQNYFNRRNPVLHQETYINKDLDWYYLRDLHTGGPAVMKCLETGQVLEAVERDEVTPK